MGNIVANASRFAIRKARRFNVENRTHRFLDENVKVAAPRHTSKLQQMEEDQLANPNMKEELSRKDAVLDNRLKDLYVSSTDPPVEIRNKGSPNRPLPVERNVIQPDFGYVEPQTSTPGRISLKCALTLLSRYEKNKEKKELENLAHDYNLKLKDVENLVEYYRVFQLVNVKETDLKTYDPSTAKELVDSLAAMTGKKLVYGTKYGKDHAEYIEKLRRK